MIESRAPATIRLWPSAGSKRSSIAELGENKGELPDMSQAGGDDQSARRAGNGTHERSETHAGRNAQDKDRNHRQQMERLPRDNTRIKKHDPLPQKTEL